MKRNTSYNVIPKRKKHSDFQDNCQKTIYSVFDKEPFALNDKDIIGNFEYIKEHSIISNQKQKNEEDAKIEQQLEKQIQIGDINRVETVVTSGDKPDTVRNEIYSKRTDEIAKNIEKPENVNVECEKLDNEGNATENIEIKEKLDAVTTFEALKRNSDHFRLEPSVLSNKEAMKKSVIISKQTELTSLIEVDHIFVNYNPTHNDRTINNIVLYMPVQKFEKLCPFNKYNYSDIEKLYIRNPVFYLINCIDPGSTSTNKPSESSAKNVRDKNRIKEYNLKQRELKSPIATKRNENYFKEKIVQDAARQKFGEVSNTQPINESRKSLETQPIFNKSQTMAHTKAISPNNKEVAFNTDPVNSGTPLHTLPMPKTNPKDGVFDMSKAFPQQLSWGSTPEIGVEPEREFKNTYPGPASNATPPDASQRWSWSMWDHPLVPTPSNRDEIPYSEKDLMPHRPSAETHQFVTPTSKIPLYPQSQPNPVDQTHQVKWSAPLETHKYEYSTFQTETQRHQPLYNMHQNNYQYPNQINMHGHTRPVAAQFPNTSNLNEGQVWTYGAIPSGAPYHMNNPNQMWMQRPGIPQVPNPSNTPVKNITSLIQPGTPCGLPQIQQNNAHSIYPEANQNLEPPLPQLQSSSSPKFMIQQEFVQPEYSKQPQYQQEYVQPEYSKQPQYQQEYVQPEYSKQPQYQQEYVQPEYSKQPQYQQESVHPEYFKQLQYQQKEVQNVRPKPIQKPEPYSLTHYQQNSLQALTPAPPQLQSNSSPQFTIQQESVQPEYFKQPQYQYQFQYRQQEPVKPVQPAPDSKTSDDVPLSELISMFKMRVSKALKFLNAEEQIKSLDMSKCGDKKPPKCPPKKCPSSIPPPKKCCPKICCPPPPLTPRCGPKIRCPGPRPPKKKCDPCITKTSDPWERNR